MNRVDGDIWIDAPVERVFAYMDRPQHQAEISPSLVDSVETGRAPNGGAIAQFTYKMAGVPLKGVVEATDWQRDDHIVFRMDGALKGTIAWRFSAERQGTRVHYSAEYELPHPVVDRVAAPFARRYNERELRSTLENLKERIEERGVPEAQGGQAGGLSP